MVLAVEHCLALHAVQDVVGWNIQPKTTYGGNDRVVSMEMWYCVDTLVIGRAVARKITCSERFGLGGQKRVRDYDDAIRQLGFWTRYVRRAIWRRGRLPDNLIESCSWHWEK